MADDSERELLEAWRQDWTAEELQWSEVRFSSRQEREDRKAQRKREAAGRDRARFGADAWGVSERHRLALCEAERLQAQNLPLLRTELELADWLQISVSRLRWFTYDRRADTAWHYVRFTIPKRRGGERVILAPKEELKALQRQVLHELLDHVPTTQAAHGFVSGRSIISNAQPHTGKAYVLNLDLKDFFPSITFARVRGLFIWLGYSFAVASTLGLLCTEHDREPYEDRDGKCYYVSMGPRHLIQGAPTSPALANLVAAPLDKRLSGLADKHQFAYTRYADDLTFSGDDFDRTLRILDAAPRIIASKGFSVHPDKTHLYRQSTRQMVTSIVVNEKASISRQLRREVRAILHNAAKTGLEAQNREQHEHFRAYLQGLIGFIAQTHPELAQEFSERLGRL